MKEVWGPAVEAAGPQIHSVGAEKGSAGMNCPHPGVPRKSPSSTTT